MQENQKCPLCEKKGIESVLVKGKALQNQVCYDSPRGQGLGYGNCFRGGPAVMITCLKCQKCGYSRS